MRSRFDLGADFDRDEASAGPSEGRRPLTRQSDNSKLDASSELEQSSDCDRGDRDARISGLSEVELCLK